MDSYPERPRIDVHDQRIRQRRVWESIRRLGLARELLADALYASGELEQPQWQALHLFRDDRQALLEARAKGQVRGSLPRDTRPRKPPGFSMRQVAIERALACERKMTPECFQWAQFLVNERFGHVEPHQARRTAWELRKFYDEP